MSVRQSINYYGRSKECLMVITNDGQNSLPALRDKWERIEAFEKNIRYDAKVFTSLIIQLPNSWSIAQAREKITGFLTAGKIKDQEYAAFLHEGKHGEVAQNFHFHLMFNERDKTTGKKNRTMSKLGFRKELIKSFQQLYGQEILQKIEKIPKIDRIDTALWKANPSEARQMKAALRTFTIETDGRLQRIAGDFSGIAAAFSKLSGAEQLKPSLDQSKSNDIGRAAAATKNQPENDQGFKRRR